MQIQVEMKGRGLLSIAKSSELCSNYQRIFNRFGLHYDESRNPVKESHSHANYAENWTFA